MGELSEEISEKMNLLGTSIQTRLKDMNLSLNNIDSKINTLINKHDKDIETAFSDIEQKVKNKCYSSASYNLNQLNLYEMYIQSHIPINKGCFKSSLITQLQ